MYPEIIPALRRWLRILALPVAVGTVCSLPPGDGSLFFPFLSGVSSARAAQKPTAEPLSSGQQRETARIMPDPEQPGTTPAAGEQRGAAPEPDAFSENASPSEEKAEPLFPGLRDTPAASEQNILEKFVTHAGAQLSATLVPDTSLPTVDLEAFPADRTPEKNAAPVSENAAEEPGHDPSWEPLLRRLEKDGFDPEEMSVLFGRLGPRAYSPGYMAAKVQELHGVSGVGVGGKDAVPLSAPAGFRQPIQEATYAECRKFMDLYAGEFEDIQKKYGVPPSIIMSILLMETRLGCDIGGHSALRSLASMALTATPEHLSKQGNSGQVTRINTNTLNSTLRDKSNWAYNELKNLIAHTTTNNMDAATLPSSKYGAVGLCQFMPSNIALFGVDGDGDGVIDLFSVPDALYSVANYLEAHGWRGAKTAQQKQAVVWQYNHDNYYASQVVEVAARLEKAAAGKMAGKASPLAGIGYSSRRAQDPSLKKAKPLPPAARIQNLGDYRDLLQ